jgi:hypothetical protein
VPDIIDAAHGMGMGPGANPARRIAERSVRLLRTAWQSM